MTMARTQSVEVGVLTRRELLKRTGRVVAAVAGGPVLAGRTTTGQADTVGEHLPVIDAHMHLTDPKHPGVPRLFTLDNVPLDGEPKALAKSLTEEMRQSGTRIALAMPGWSQVSESDPLAIHHTLQVAKALPTDLRVLPVGVVDPTRSHDKTHMKRVEAALERKEVRALKAYLGYLHYGPEAEEHRRYYALAGKYGVPVFFHTGDTYSRKAKLKYAHPLPIDEVAVDYPHVRFVIAHFGNPWILDAAEVVYKNNQLGEGGNVWADLSALFVEAQTQGYGKAGILDEIKGKVTRGIAFTERPDRFLYASDWPLNHMAYYRDFIRDVVPAEHHRAVFCDNARSLFSLDE